MKSKRLLSIILVFIMVLGIMPGTFAEAEDARLEAEALRLEFEVYRYTSTAYPFTNPTTLGQTPEQCWGPKVDLTTESLNVDDIIIVAIKYTGLSSITDYGLAVIGVDVGYDFEYFSPMAPAGTFNPPATVGAGTIASTTAWRNWVTSFIYPSEKGEFGDAYKYDCSDKAPEGGVGTIRRTYFHITTLSPDAFTAINEDSGYVNAIGYRVKKATPAGENTNFEFLVNGVAAMSVYIDSGYIEKDLYYNFEGLEGILSNLVSADITIENKSWKADIPSADITKNYVAGTANLESDSEIVIKNLTNGVKTKPVGRTAVAQLYDEDGVEIGVPAVATGNDIDGYNIVLPLPSGEDQDFTIIIIERDDAEPSGPADLFAASQKPDVEEVNILKKFAIDGTLGDNNGVRIYTVGEQPVDEDTIINLYLEDDINVAPYASFTGTVKDDDDLDYIFARLTGLLDDVYYLTAQQGERKQTPYATRVDKFLSLSPAEVEVINNFEKTGETNSYMIIKTVQAGGTTPEPAREGTEFNLYEVIDTSGTKTADKLVPGIIQPISSVVADEGGVKITLPKDIMTKDGTEYYLSAIEPNKLESDKALIGAAKSGITIIDIVDPDDELDPDDQDKLAASEYKAIPDPIIVVDGTTRAQFDDFNLLTSKVPVRLESSKPDENTGKDTWIDFVTVTWDGLPDDQFTKTGGDEGTEYYTLTAEFYEEEITDLGLLLPTTSLTVTVQVVDSPSIMLNKGNALGSDVTSGYATSLNDVFVYYQYFFRDPGFTVTDYAGNDVTSSAVVTRSIVIEDMKTDIGYYDSNEILTCFTINNTTEYSKHYTITYEYVDPNLPYITVTETREVYVIFKLGNITRTGTISALDSDAALDHVREAKPLDLSDVLYKVKTCEVTGNSISAIDVDAIDADILEKKLIVQQYDVDEVNKVMFISP